MSDGIKYIITLKYLFISLDIRVGRVVIIIINSYVKFDDDGVTDGCDASD